MPLDIEHLRSWIGREESADEILTPDLVRRFNAMLDREGDTSPGAPAPIMIHYCLCQPAAPTASLGDDGHPPRGGFMPPVPLQRRMWAGGGLDFTGDIRIGETVTRISRISDVSMKEGRSGVLCFVTLEHVYTSDGRPALTERQNIVYREPAAEVRAKAAPEPAPAGQHVRRVTPTAPLLFRYSALTYNGHRIHYDVPYTRDVEGYPGLVVHGPLQATLLAYHALDLKGTRPSQFNVRAMTPLFDTADFTVNATAEGEAMRLWTATTGGPVAMEAHARW